MPFAILWNTHPAFRRTSISASVLTVIIGMAVGASTWFTSGHGTSPPGLGAASNIIQDSTRERIEAEVITLTATGFEPKEITRPSGSFLLAVSNRSGLEDLVLHLDRIGGNRMQELRLSRKRRGWQGTINLPAGEYILSEANNPNWSCQIIITGE